MRTEGSYNPEQYIKSEEDSVILSTPQLASSMNMVSEFNNFVDKPRKEGEAKGRDRQKAMIDRLSKELVVDPTRAIDTINSLELLADIPGYRSEDFKNSLIEKLKKVNLPKDAGVLEKWMTVMVEDQIYGELAEALLTNKINKLGNEKELVDFIYELCVGGFFSGNKKISDKLVEILSYKTDILKTESRQALLFVISKFSSDNDILAKRLEIEGAIGLHSQKSDGLEDIVKNYSEVEANIYESDEFKNEFDRRLKDVGKDEGIIILKRMEKLNDLYNKENDIPIEKILRGDKTGLLRALTKSGELGKFVANEGAKLIKSENNEDTFSVILPTATSIANGLSQDEINSGLLEFLKKTGGGSDEVHLDTEYWETLSQIMPDNLDLEEGLKELGELNVSLKQDIQDNTRYSLSPRGDRVEITDPELLKLGFETVTYTINESNKKEVIVDVKIGLYTFRLLLDQYVIPRNAKTQKPINFSGKGEFIKNIILSHLREIKCSEKVRESTGDGNDAEVKSFISRRGHVRVLQEGQSPGFRQASMGLEYGIDINAINMGIKKDGGTRFKTFVSPSVADISGKGPVRCKTETATKKLDEIIKKNRKNKE